MKAKHTPEPWYAVEFAGYHMIQDGEYYEDTPLLDEDKCNRAKANAARIVECVNALAGFSSEQIQQIRAWANTPETNLLFDYVSKNRLLEAENAKLKKEVKDLENMFENLSQRGE